jgi:hypothetical protein
VEGARGAAQDAAERLRALEAEAEAAIHDLGARILPLEQGLLREEPAPRGNPLAWLGLRRGEARHAADGRWLEYFRARLQRASFRAVSGLLRALRAQATALRDRLTDARRMLLQLAERFEAGPPAGRRPGPAEPLLARLDDMAQRLDREFQAFLRPRGGLRAVLERENDSLGPAGAALRQAARSVVFHTLREIDLPGMLALAPGSDQPIGPAARAWLDAAAPRLPACGGGRRMLLVVPAGGPADRLAETVERGAGLRPTVVCDAGPDLALCCEIGEISVSRAIDALLGDRRQCAEIAARLHTRIDISWSK